ncbi:MAG TPA: efflux transporter outer membrane subunit [Steroidobacteraceae bacterium]|nr:efflux transporter outer membrane subunit [Steroidobacteraceae bacterium]
MTLRAPVVLIALLAVSSGCAVGPSYEEPHLATPPSFGELPGSAGESPLSAPSSAEADLTEWWRQFHDRELERLVDRALRSNLDLLTAASRIRQAREQEIIAGAALLPSVGSSVSGTRLHANSNPLANGGSSPLALAIYSLAFDASWEVDLFGGTRRGIEAARAGAEAAVWDMRDAEVSLTAEVANDYIQLRATQARIAIAQDAVRRQQDLLTLAQARASTGFVTELDVNQQRAQLAATRAELPALASERQTLMHALAVLLAASPQALVQELSPSAPVPGVPVSLPGGLPSDLLRRRPDVRAAERRLAAATAEEGVAVAALYPKFDLLGLAAFAGSSAGSLVSSKNFDALGLGFIDWPIFEGGKRRANIRASEELRAQSYLAYRRSVLAALQDTEDALVRYRDEQQRLVALREEQAAADASLDIAAARYRAGLVTFIDVLQASATDLNARDQVEQGVEGLAQDLVSLYKALGGGWGAPRDPPLR